MKKLNDYQNDKISFALLFALLEEKNLGRIVLPFWPMIFFEVS